MLEIKAIYKRFVVLKDRARKKMLETRPSTRGLLF
jgi:hypothetical protein